MLIPLGVLTFGAVFAGFIFHDQFVGAQRGAEFWNGSLAFDEHLMHAMHDVPLLVKLAPGIVMLIGLFIAFMASMLPTGLPEQFTRHFLLLYNFLLYNCYFDDLYNFLFVHPPFPFVTFF